MAFRLLGIDPGIATTGYALLINSQTRLYTCGVITTATGTNDQIRLCDLYKEATALFGYLKPTVVSIEKLFFGNNVTTAIRVAQARGVVLAAVPRGVPIYEYTPSEVKKVISGSGKADKIQMQEAVVRILGLEARIQPDDANDAVALAIHHARVAGL